MGLDAEAAGVFSLLATVLIGLCLGSFATALAWRLPRGESMISKKRSGCPKCDSILGVFELVPLLSWLWLAGKCRKCGNPIGWQYPVIELATVTLCLAFYFSFGFTLQTVFMFALAPVLVAMTDIDFRFRIIPDGLNLSLLAIGIAVLFAGAFATGNPPRFVTEEGALAVAGMAVYGLGALALRAGGQAVLKREPLGLGDVKFFAAAGFWLGPGLEKIAWFMIVAGASGIALALLWKRVTGEREFPFGPSLLLAFAVLLFAAPPSFIVFP